MTKSIIQEKSFDFAIMIIDIHTMLIETRDFSIADQILRSGTSIGANVEEALGAISRRDFLSKMFIALKEARETRYWINLLIATNKMNKTTLEEVLNLNIELIKILVTICKSARLKLISSKSL